MSSVSCARFAATPFNFAVAGVGELAFFNGLESSSSARNLLAKAVFSKVHVVSQECKN